MTINRCFNLSSPLSGESFIKRRESLTTILRRHTSSPSSRRGSDIFITEPGITSSYYTGISTDQWSLSERTFLIGITSTSSSTTNSSSTSDENDDDDDDDDQTRIIILTPKFESSRARLLIIPGLNDDNDDDDDDVHGFENGEKKKKKKKKKEDLEFVEWEEWESPFEVFVNHLLRSDEVGIDEEVDGKNGKKIFLDPYVRSFIFDGLNRAIQDDNNNNKGLEGGLGLGMEDWKIELAKGDLIVRERKSEEEIELLRCANEVSFLSLFPIPPSSLPLPTFVVFFFPFLIRLALMMFSLLLLLLLLLLFVSSLWKLSNQLEMRCSLGYQNR